MTRYWCAICRFVYDEIEESIVICELSNDLEYPLCNAARDVFETQEEVKKVPILSSLQVDNYGCNG